MMKVAPMHIAVFMNKLVSMTRALWVSTYLRNFDDAHLAGGPSGRKIDRRAQDLESMTHEEHGAPPPIHSKPFSGA